MKTKLIIGLVLLLWPAGKIRAQWRSDGAAIADQQRMQMQQQIAGYARQEARQEAQAQYDTAVTAELNKIYSKDPWRKIGESTVFARGTGWVEFQGRVEEARPNGAVFKGKWGAVMTVFTDASENPHLIIKTDSNDTSQRARGTTTYGSSRVQDTSFQHKILYGDDLFFVENFPYPASSGESYEKMMALDSDYYSYHYCPA